MNQEKRILVCEDSMEGIFSAVYDGWKECAGGCKVSIQTSFPVSMELFTSYREIATDQSKVGKVMRTILMRLGSEVYRSVWRQLQQMKTGELPFIMCCTGLLGEADAKNV